MGWYEVRLCESPPRVDIQLHFDIQYNTCTSWRSVESTTLPALNQSVPAVSGESSQRAALPVDNQNVSVAPHEDRSMLRVRTCRDHIVGCLVSENDYITEHLCVCHLFCWTVLWLTAQRGGVLERLYFYLFTYILPPKIIMIIIDCVCQSCSELREKLMINGILLNCNYGTQLDPFRYITALLHCHMLCTLALTDCYVMPVHAKTQDSWLSQQATFLSLEGVWFGEETNNYCISWTPPTEA